jgi:hypothetical protein
MRRSKKILDSKKKTLKVLNKFFQSFFKKVFQIEILFKNYLSNFESIIYNYNFMIIKIIYYTRSPFIYIRLIIF